MRPAVGGGPLSFACGFTMEDETDEEVRQTLARTAYTHTDSPPPPLFLPLLTAAVHHARTAYTHTDSPPPPLFLPLLTAAVHARTAYTSPQSYSVLRLTLRLLPYYSSTNIGYSFFFFLLPSSILLRLTLRLPPPPGTSSSLRSPPPPAPPPVSLTPSPPTSFSHHPPPVSFAGSSSCPQHAGLARGTRYVINIFQSIFSLCSV
jgi:hypothetical protein